MRGAVCVGLCLLGALVSGGCSPKLLASKTEKGEFVEVREIASQQRVDHKIRLQLLGDAVAVAVESERLLTAEVADAHARKQVETYQGCGVGDFLSLTIGLPFMWLVKLSEAPYCLFGDEYQEEQILAGEYVLDNQRTVVKEREKVAPPQTVTAQVNGKAIGNLELSGEGTARFGLTKHAFSLWPHHTNSLCYLAGKDKACIDLTAEQLQGIVKKNGKEFAKFRPEFYDKCVQDKHLYSCLWAGMLYSSVTPVDQNKSRNSYFRSCVFSEKNIGCQEAAQLGAAREVEDVLNKKASVARAEAEKRRVEEEMRARQLALERERERMEREAEEQRARQERLLAQQEREENMKMWMDGLKQLSDTLDQSYQQQQQQMRAIYGY